MPFAHLRLTTRVCLSFTVFRFLVLDSSGCRLVHVPMHASLPSLTPVRTDREEEITKELTDFVQGAEHKRRRLKNHDKIPRLDGHADELIKVQSHTYQAFLRGVLNPPDPDPEFPSPCGWSCLSTSLKGSRGWEGVRRSAFGVHLLRTRDRLPSC